MLLIYGRCLNDCGTYSILESWFQLCNWRPALYKHAIPCKYCMYNGCLILRRPVPSPWYSLLPQLMIKISSILWVHLSADILWSCMEWMPLCSTSNIEVPTISDVGVRRWIGSIFLFGNYKMVNRLGKLPLYVMQRFYKKRFELG